MSVFESYYCPEDIDFKIEGIASSSEIFYYGIVIERCGSENDNRNIKCASK